MGVNKQGQRRKELEKLTKARLIDLVVSNESKSKASTEKVRLGIYVGGQSIFARDLHVVREDGKVLCRSVLQLPPTDTDRPVVMIGRSITDHESRAMDLHQVRFQSGFVCKIRFGDDLYSVTILRDREAVWHTLWVNYDGPAVPAWEEWTDIADAAEDAAFQRKAAELQGMQESA